MHGAPDFLVALRTAAHVRPDRDGLAMASMGLAGEAGVRQPSAQSRELLVELRQLALDGSKAYFDTKTSAQAEKYFWKNSIAAYGWIHREKGQPGK